MKTPCIAVLLVTLTAPAIAQDAPDKTAPVTKWFAKEVPSEVVDTIINRNMFVPDQRRAPRVEAPPKPEGDEEVKLDEAAPPVETRPEDPRQRFRLIGSSFSTGRWIAFIEQMDTGDIQRITIDGEIADGTVATIDYDRIEYQADGETTPVLIGRDLTGAEVAMPASSHAGASGSAAPSASAAPSTNNNGSPAAAPSDADARRAEILRQLRERRERENQ